MTKRSWAVAYWVLMAGWLLGAGLGMAKVRAGFFTNYLADLAFPPWYYIVVRGLASRDGRAPTLVRWFGRTPERAAVSIFLVGLVSELTQRFAPSIIAGTYDTWDIASYAAGLGVCYLCDRNAGS